jgi:hypothetical protein
MPTHVPGCPLEGDGDGCGADDGGADVGVGVGAGAGGVGLGAPDVGLVGAGPPVDPGGVCRETGEL